MVRTKAERRHHHFRMIDRASKFMWLQSQYWNGDEEHRQKVIRQLAETRHPCSCHMCGNARKLWKEQTLQEKKFKLKEKDWYDESE